MVMAALLSLVLDAMWSVCGPYSDHRDRLEQELRDLERR